MSRSRKDAIRKHIALKKKRFITLETTDGSGYHHERGVVSVHDAQAHVDSQSHIPVVLRDPLLLAEVGCRVNRGRVAPFATLHPSADTVKVPADVDGERLCKFLRNTLIEAGGTSIHFAYIGDDSGLHVIYLDRDQGYAAHADVTTSGDAVRIGTWSIEDIVQTADATRDNLPSITHDEFAQIVLERIANAGEGREIKYDPTAFTLTLASGDQLLLGRVYSEYHSAKYSREAILQNVVDAWLRPPDTFHGLQEAAPVLWPIVRHRLSFHMPIPGSSLVPHQLLGRHLALGIATAHGTTLKLVDQETLDRWGVTFSDALTVALRHLQSEVTKEDFVAVSQGVYRSLRRDSFGGSLLCSDILDRLAIKGAPVVVAPNRHTLLVTGADDPPGLQAVASLAKSELDDPHQQTGTPITFVGGNWVDFEVPLDHPAYPLFREHERRAASGAYSHQSNLLAAYQRENRDDADRIRTLHAARRVWCNSDVQCVAEGRSCTPGSHGRHFLYRGDWRRQSYVHGRPLGTS